MSKRTRIASYATPTEAAEAVIRIAAADPEAVPSIVVGFPGPWWTVYSTNADTARRSVAAADR